MNIWNSWYKFVLAGVGIIFGIFFTVEGIIYLVCPVYKTGNYKMIYRVYYPNNPREYVIKNDLPISLESYKGSNRICKTKEFGIFGHQYRDISVIETTAPIEIVSYTFKEK